MKVLDGALVGAFSRHCETSRMFVDSSTGQASRYAVRPRVVEFRLEKSEGGWWERLLKERARQHWLRRLIVPQKFPSEGS